MLTSSTDIPAALRSRSAEQHALTIGSARSAANRGRRGRRHSGGGAAPPVLPLSTGTIVRNLAAYQRDRDPAVGAFMSQVGVNVLRWETLGGVRTALLEGSRTNNIKNSRDHAAAGWTAGSGNTKTTGHASPDGTNNATREVVPSGGWGAWQNAPVATTAPMVTSMWQMAGATSDGSYQATFYNGATFKYWAALLGLTTAWQRVIMQHLTGTGSSVFQSDGRAGGAGGIAAGAHDTIADFIQTEAGRFASSPIVNPGATGMTRPADVLTFATVPDSLLAAGPHGFAHVRPEWTSSIDVVDGDIFGMFSSSGGGGLGRVAVEQASGIMTVNLRDHAGVLRAQSQPFTTLTDEDLGPVAWDLAGRVWVNGTPGPVGGTCVWQQGPARVGGVYGGASEAFCGLSDIY